MKYKVGDWVQLVGYRPPHWNPQGEMDKYLNNTVQLTEVKSNYIEFDGSEHWYFEVGDIAGYAKNKIVTDILMDL